MRVWLTSPWIPPDWVKAHGLEPRGIWSAPEFQPGAHALAAGVCPFAEAVVRFAENERDGLFVFSTTCDQLRRGSEAVGPSGQARSFLFNIPATRTPAARKLYAAELKRLSSFLVAGGGVAPEPARLLDSLMFREAQSEPKPAPAGNRVLVAIVGVPLDRSHRGLVEAIEAAGAAVVLDGTENGERAQCVGRPAPALGEDAFDTLSRHWFESIVDVFQRPNRPLYEWLEPRLRERGASGILLWCYTGCDLWRAEAQTLRETFGLPVLLLENSGSTGVSQRDLNRVQAFVETLG